MVEFPAAMPVKRRSFESLGDYFDYQQQRAKADPKFRPDTMEAMAKRHNVVTQTIWRIKKNQPTSYGLARELADAYHIKFKSFTILRPQKRSA